MSCQLLLVRGWYFVSVMVMYSCDKIRGPSIKIYRYDDMTMPLCCMTIRLSMLRWENVKELFAMLNSWKGSRWLYMSIACNVGQ